MKRKILLLLCLVMLVLSACGKEESIGKVDTEYYECHKGFMGGYGNRIHKSPDGYYFMAGYYLMFADSELENTTIVCNKPECLHNAESPENRVNCNAFYGGGRALAYYDGKVYILCDSHNGQESVPTIFAASLDGSERKEVYVSEGEVEAFCLHRGDVYLYEKNYTDKEGNIVANPVLNILRFPISNSKKVETLYQETSLESGDINYLNCYGDYCFFRVIGNSEGKEYSKTFKMQTETGDIQTCMDDSHVYIGKDTLFGINTLTIDSETMTWTNAYSRADVKETETQTLTEEDFAAIGKNATLLMADDQYVYFQDIIYGGDMVPVEEQKLYVYNYEGDSVAEIPFGELQWAVDFYAGDERYAFFYDMSQGIRFYYIDKEDFANGAKVETLFYAPAEEYLGAIIY